MARGYIEPPKLDDRTWQDLVDQARALIPEYAPQWTDPGPGDLGMTLIELFAWLVEGMIYRLNRVPDRNYVAFLNLLGITRNPATPALTMLTFTSSAVVELPEGSQAATQQTETQQAIVFRTDAPLTVLPVNLVALQVTGLVPQGDPPTPTPADMTSRLVGRTEPDKAQALEGAKMTLAKDEAVFHLYFDATTRDRLPYTLHVLVAEPTWSGAGALTLTYRDAKQQEQPIKEVEDRTRGLRRTGTITFTRPDDWAPVAVPGIGPEAGKPGYRLQLTFKRTSPASDREGPTILDIGHLLFNSVPATAAVLTVEDEVVGVGTGSPSQSYELIHRPLYKDPSSADPYGHVKLEVDEPQPDGRFVREVWTRVAEFPRGNAPNYRLDPVTGTIEFGGAGRGKIPRERSRIVATYQYVSAGVAGNLPASAINTMRGKFPPQITSVTNRVPALGGTDEEDVEQAKRRAPRALRNFDRAVTVEDYEQLARRASNRVVKVRCLGPRFAKGKGEKWTYGGLDRREGAVAVIVLGDVADSDRAKGLVRMPGPTSELIHEVLAFLDDRRPLTTPLVVTGPRYLEVTVTVAVRLWPDALSDGGEGKEQGKGRLAVAIDEAIAGYLHPLRGKKDGNGWEVGESLFLSGLFDFLQPLIGNRGYIERLSALGKASYVGSPNRDKVLKQDGEGPALPETVGVGVLDYELVCSGRKADASKPWHEIDVKYVGEGNPR